MIMTHTDKTNIYSTLPCLQLKKILAMPLVRNNRKWYIYICYHHVGILSYCQLPTYQHIPTYLSSRNFRSNKKKKTHTHKFWGGEEATWNSRWSIDFQFRNGGWRHRPIRQTVWQTRLVAVSLVIFVRKNHHGPWLLIVVVGGWTNPFDKYARQIGSPPQGFLLAANVGVAQFDSGLSTNMSLTNLMGKFGNANHGSFEFYRFYLMPPCWLQ